MRFSRLFVLACHFLRIISVVTQLHCYACVGACFNTINTQTRHIRHSSGSIEIMTMQDEDAIHGVCAAQRQREIQTERETFIAIGNHLEQFIANGNGADGVWKNRPTKQQQLTTQKHSKKLYRQVLQRQSVDEKPEINISHITPHCTESHTHTHTCISHANRGQTTSSVCHTMDGMHTASKDCERAKERLSSKSHPFTRQFVQQSVKQVTVLWVEHSDNKRRSCLQLNVIDVIPLLLQFFFRFSFYAIAFFFPFIQRFRCLALARVNILALVVLFSRLFQSTTVTSLLELAQHNTHSPFLHLFFVARKRLFDFVAHIRCISNDTRAYLTKFIYVCKAANANERARTYWPRMHQRANHID